MMAWIGDAPLDEVVDAEGVLLAEIAQLKRENGNLRDDRDQYRNEANRLRRAAA